MTMTFRKSLWGMINRSIFAVFATIVALFVGGCATTNSAGQQLTPAEIAARTCPAIKTTLTSLQALNGISAENRALLAKGDQIVTVMCAPGGIPTKLDLETIINQGGPLAISIINGSSMSPEAKDRAILNVTMIQIMAQGLLQAQGALK
jgi:hypothetical protein